LEREDEIEIKKNDNRAPIPFLYKETAVSGYLISFFLFLFPVDRSPPIPIFSYKRSDG